MPPKPIFALIASFPFCLNCLGSGWGGASFLVELEAQAQAAVGVVVAGDAEVADLGGVGHVQADAGAHVVVAHHHEAQRASGFGGQAAEVDRRGRVASLHVFGPDVEMAVYHFVDLALHFGYLLVGGALGQQVVAFAFLAFDVRIDRARASEHADHGAVQDVLGGVHGRIFLFCCVR